MRIVYVLAFAGCPPSTRLKMPVKGKGMACGFKASPMVSKQKEKEIVLYLNVLLVAGQFARGTNKLSSCQSERSALSRNTLLPIVYKSLSLLHTHKILLTVPRVWRHRHLWMGRPIGDPIKHQHTASHRVQCDESLSLFQHPA